MLKLMFLSGLAGCIIGYISGYRGSRFFGAVKGIGLGLFLGMCVSFILYVIHFIEKSYF